MKAIIDWELPFSLFYSNQDHQFVLYEKPKLAFAYYQDHRINLISGKKEIFSILDFKKYLGNQSFPSQAKQKKIWHWFYELSSPHDKNLLAIELEYKHAQKIDDRFIKNQAIQLKLIHSPEMKTYQKQFEKIQSELLRGNCYQLNLTHQFIYEFDKNLNPLDFFSLWKKTDSRGAFAHASYIPHLKKLFLSNSPECLFQKKGKSLYSFPIKGTAARNNPEQLFTEKNTSELDMISDLMRNDLAKLTGEIATVIRKRKLLKVPGLLHAYSVIKSPMGKDLSLEDFATTLFPGGSITGAPKKRVIELIASIEGAPRGFYCGSTVLSHDRIQTASINIRSATIDFSTRRLSYGAGGGITLLSKSQEEYNEMLAKRDSFINLFSRL